MRLLVDNNISPRVSRALHAVVSGEGHEVWSVRDKYGAAARDVDWITRLGEEGGWAFLSGDHRI